MNIFQSIVSWFVKIWNAITAAFRRDKLTPAVPLKERFIKHNPSPIRETKNVN